MYACVVKLDSYEPIKIRKRQDRGDLISPTCLLLFLYVVATYTDLYAYIIY